ncbi:hypothetical protein RJ639_007643 [Escallonia herrerae]|uniref:Tetratricopeptide repeat protein n=1 Tax=Escallonia herrerae TaxID=1293975 RepID=A0AA88VXI6_9ASTE|nr:hypothetical protein RJ639_007643 [Escallonia herrerae]
MMHQLSQKVARLIGVGVAVAVVVFGLVFAGDFLPSGSIFSIFSSFHCKVQVTTLNDYILRSSKHGNPVNISFGTRLQEPCIARPRSDSAGTYYLLMFKKLLIVIWSSMSSVSPTKEATMVNKISGEEKANLQTRLQQYEATLTISPEDPVALEGAAVTLAELGEYSRAATLLEDLTKKNLSDAEALRLLGEVTYELKDYEGSVAAYKRSAMVSKTVDFNVLRGLTNALLAASKPDEAVQVLLASRQQLDTRKSNSGDLVADGSVSVTDSLVDPIQVELLLGKAYSDWGHVSDAVSVYDQLISSHPDDFSGLLGKGLFIHNSYRFLSTYGIILKENGKFGDAERMFIQARFFAPEKAKALVERYAKR